jgi:hypothetical protein
VFWHRQTNAWGIMKAISPWGGVAVNSGFPGRRRTGAHPGRLGSGGVGESAGTRREGSLWPCPHGNHFPGWGDGPLARGHFGQQEATVNHPQTAVGSADQHAEHRVRCFLAVQPDRAASCLDWEVWLERRWPGLSSVWHRAKWGRRPGLHSFPMTILTTSSAPPDVGLAYREHAGCYLQVKPSPSQHWPTVETISAFSLGTVILPSTRGDPR